MAFLELKNHDISLILDRFHPAWYLVPFFFPLHLEYHPPMQLFIPTSFVFKWNLFNFTVVDKLAIEDFVPELLLPVVFTEIVVPPATEAKVQRNFLACFFT